MTPFSLSLNEGCSLLLPFHQVDKFELHLIIAFDTALPWV